MSEMRLQRALARAGIASRRAAEQLIEDGRVRVDGKVATLGSKVDPDRQRITVGGQAVKLPKRRWLAFHKPLGVVTTASDEEGRRTVFDFVKDPKGLAYVGRLDVNTTGLLLLTTDGDAVHRLTPTLPCPPALHGAGTRPAGRGDRERGQAAGGDRRPGGRAVRGAGAARERRTQYRRRYAHRRPEPHRSAMGGGARV